MSDNLAYAWDILEIVWINLLLSGDNAILIALACRGLPDKQRRLGIGLGALGAVGLRIVFTFALSALLNIPVLKIAGGMFVVFLAVKLPGQVEAQPEIKARSNLLDAVRAIIVADALMSLDNVLALAAAAHGSMALIVFGLALSAPLVMFGAHFLSALMARWPFLIWVGAVILGWAGGELLAGDTLWKRFDLPLDSAAPLVGAAAAAFVLAAGLMIRKPNPASSK
jgi:YjbE family integral membrane protein